MFPTNKKGYTLIEFIAVVGLMFLLAVPAFTFVNYNNFKTDFIVRAYVSDIRYVYHKNSFGDINCYITYIFEDEILCNKVIGYRLYERYASKKEVYFPSNIKLTGQSYKPLRFNLGGSLNLKGETVYITNVSTNDKYKVTIVPISGRVAIYKNE